MCDTMALLPTDLLRRICVLSGHPATVALSKSANATHWLLAERVEFWRAAHGPKALERAARAGHLEIVRRLVDDAKPGTSQLLQVVDSAVPNGRIDVVVDLLGRVKPVAPKYFHLVKSALARAKVSQTRIIEALWSCLPPTKRRFTMQTSSGRAVGRQWSAPSPLLAAIKVAYVHKLDNTTLTLRESTRWYDRRVFTFRIERGRVKCVSRALLQVVD